MHLPYPSVNFPRLIQQGLSEQDIPSQLMQFEKSGEITSSIVGQPLGIAVEAGVVTDFVVGLQGQGRDDSNDLSLAVTLKKNGTSIISGEVDLTGVSGEAAAATFNAAAPTFVDTTVARGDRFTVDCVLTRTASPDTEMNNLFSAIKIVPVK